MLIRGNSIYGKRERFQHRILFLKDTSLLDSYKNFKTNLKIMPQLFK